MTNQLSNQPPKLPFFYRQLPIILGVIIMIIITGGILAWQYFRAPEEVKAPEREEIKTPEKVALQFLSWYCQVPALAHDIVDSNNDKNVEQKHRA